MSALDQYGVANGTLLPLVVVPLEAPQVDPPNPVEAPDVEAVLRWLIAAGHVDPTRPDLLCCLFTPPGWQTSNSHVAGYHQFFDDGAGHTVCFAWIRFKPAGLPSLTAILSHELVEACTDPHQDGLRIDGQEIGDVCHTHEEYGGVSVQDYYSVRDRQCVLPQEPAVAGRVRGNPAFIQGRFLWPGNFELVVPLQTGGLAHYSRVNSDARLPWYGPTVFGLDIGVVDAVSMIQSNFTAGPGIGNLELVARFQGQLVFYWREDVPPYVWHGPTVVPNTAGVSGVPSLIQGRFLRRGNFELVTPLASGGLAHYSRVNDVAGVPWAGPEVFAQDMGVFDAVSLVQTAFSSGGGAGDLHIVASARGQLFFYRRDDVPPYAWHGPEVVPIALPGASDPIVNGCPSLVFAPFGPIVHGFDEILVPVAPSGFAHVTREDQFGVMWNGPSLVGPQIGQVDALSAIRSSFSFTGSGLGNIELIVLSQGQLFHFWRQDRNWFADTTANTVDWFGPWVVTE
jgi:hypothetical protein